MCAGSSTAGRSTPASTGPWTTGESATGTHRRSPSVARALSAASASRPPSCGTAVRRRKLTNAKPKTSRSVSRAAPASQSTARTPFARKPAHRGGSGAGARTGMARGIGR